MDDLFRKTINLFNAPGGVDDDFVGQIVEVGSIKLKILKKIAEGKKLENFHLVIKKKHIFSYPIVFSQC